MYAVQPALGSVARLAWPQDGLPSEQLEASTLRIGSVLAGSNSNRSPSLEVSQTMPRARPMSP